MKVCVVGGAGYIGSHVVLELLRQKNEVVVIDNLSTGFKELVDDSAAFYKADITNYEELKKVFNKEKNIDVVMHFAAKLIVPESLEEPLEYYHNNIEGLRTLLSVMVENNIKNIIFSSTAAVYGMIDTDVITEEDKTEPINPYGETKLACEKMIKWVTERYDMNYCIFRYFNAAGADESLKTGYMKSKITHLIPIVIGAALGERESVTIFGDDFNTPDGTCIRDYIHVNDLAKAHVLGAEYILKEKKSLLCNLGTNNGYSVKEVISEVGKILPVNYKIGERRAGDPAKLIASNEKAKETLKWSPKYSLKEIVETDMKFKEKLMKK